MKNKMKIIFTSFLVLTLLGCASSTSVVQSSSNSTAASEQDGTLVTVAIDTDLNSMDNQITADGGSFTMQTLCGSGLVEVDANGNPKPDLADSWDISDDQLTYTFHLKDDITWSNGDPITASDFVYGWERVVDPNVASEYSFIMPTLNVVNANEIIAGTADKTELGVEAVDSKTFVVHLTQPSSFLLGLMAFPCFFPLNQKFFESQGDQYALGIDNMLYSGPYTMTGWEQGNEYTFTKNNQYWDADNISTDTVVFKFIQDTQSAMLSYQAGDIDVVKLSGEQVDAYKDTEGFENRLQGYSWRLDFNLKDATASDLNLRKAISYAIDRDSICSNVLKDGSVPAEGYVSRELYYDANGKDYRDLAGKLVSYDPDSSSKYYEAAKQDNGGKDITIELLFEDSEASKSVAENIQQMLQENCPGLTVTLTSKPKKTRLQLMDDLNYQMGLTRCGPDYADPQTFMWLFETGNPGDNTTYSNADYDALMKAAETTDAGDADKRIQDMVEAEKILVTTDYACVPVYQNGGAIMVNPKVTGIEFHSAGVDNYRHMVVTK